MITKTLLKFHPFKLPTFVHKLCLPSVPIWMTNTGSHRMKGGSLKTGFIVISGCLVTPSGFCSECKVPNTILVFTVLIMPACGYLKQTQAVCCLPSHSLTKAVYPLLDKSWDSGAWQGGGQLTPRSLRGHVKSWQVHSPWCLARFSLLWGSEHRSPDFNRSCKNCSWPGLCLLAPRTGTSAGAVCLMWWCQVLHGGDDNGGHATRPVTGFSPV